MSQVEDKPPRPDEQNLRRDEFQILDNYFTEKSPTFVELRQVQREVWNLPSADTHFAQQAHRADTASPALQRRFFRMMQRIGHELHKAHNIIPPPLASPNLQVLDICMAPGGYSATVLKHNPTAQIFGLSLPETDGGHPVLLKDNPRVHVQFTDITMLAAEMGGAAIVPAGHPMAARC
ncbi:hypothetical protein FE257_008560 [Aspergillus nanangensis]|uniref:Ribosomal RNA methyltransferase FtsJ domain-containing protein n=1 Tax=Aspergillus nanangensis TaxID=2582783 RepID=A0AAD4GUN4_ASPNN|nr:hypothetical protein FE257_008560 [Aspergillus nanangensis]